MKAALGVLALALSAEALAAPLPSLATPRFGAAVASDADGRVYVIGGSGDGAERWDPKARRWTAIAAPSFSRLGAGCGWLDGKLVLVGGGATSHPLAYVTTPEAYDPAADRWTPLAFKTAGRRDVAVVSDGKSLLVTGGSGPRYGSPAPAVVPGAGEADFLDAWGIRLVERLTPEARGLARAMTRRRSEHAAVLVGKTPYVVGGGFQGDLWGYPEEHVEVGVSYLNPTVEAYDAAANAWRVVATLPTPRKALAAAVDARGRIVVVGGRAARKKVVGTVEIFDPATGQWSTGAAMPTPRESFALATTEGGVLLAVGGRDAEGHALCLVEAYDPATDRWTAGGESRR